MPVPLFTFLCSFFGGRRDFSSPWGLFSTASRRTIGNALYSCVSCITLRNVTRFMVHGHPGRVSSPLLRLRVAGMIGRKKIHLLTILCYDRQPWQRHKLTVRLNWINTTAFGGLLRFIPSEVERKKGGKRFRVQGWYFFFLESRKELLRKPISSKDILRFWTN